MFLVTVTVGVDTDGDGVVDDTFTYHNEWVFEIPELIAYWWDYENSGCRLTQVRFYPVESIPEEGTANPWQTELLSLVFLHQLAWAPQRDTLRLGA